MQLPFRGTSVILEEERIDCHIGESCISKACRKMLLFV